MRTIRVTGKGQIKVHPDMTRVRITLEGTYKDYAKTLKHCSRETEELRTLLAPFGFEGSDLKTLHFDVDTKYERYDENNIWKQRFVGYKYSHVMKVEFESDNDRLGKILYALGNSTLNPEFSISYTVKDPEAAKNELLGDAVRDAVAKAGVLADAAGLSLGDIQAVDYSWSEIDFEVHPMGRPQTTLAEENCIDLNIEPDDIELQDTVTVVWEIA